MTLGHCVIAPLGIARQTRAGLSFSTARICGLPAIHKAQSTQRATRRHEAKIPWSRRSLICVDKTDWSAFLFASRGYEKHIVMRDLERIGSVFTRQKRLNV